MALSVPLSRFTSRVGGGSAFYVRRHRTVANMSTMKLTLWAVVAAVIAEAFIACLMLGHKGVRP